MKISFYIMNEYGIEFVIGILHLGEGISRGYEIKCRLFLPILKNLKSVLKQPR